MAPETGEATREGGPGLLGGEPGSSSKTHSEMQGRKAAAEGVIQQVMAGNLGPIGLLARPGGEPPRVVVQRQPSKAFVWISAAPWGMSDGLREFLEPEHPSVERYATLLALKLRNAATKERDRRTKLKEMVQREREARLASRRDSGR